MPHVAWDFAGGIGLLGIVGFLVVAAFWGLILVGLVYGVRWLVRADRNSRLPPGPNTAGVTADDPLSILRQRYARGEIDDEEFERRKRTLAGS